MNSEELKKRTGEFAHRCVKLALILPKNVLGDHINRLYTEAHEMASILIVSRRTAQSRKQS